MSMLSLPFAVAMLAAQPAAATTRAGTDAETKPGLVWGTSRGLSLMGDGGPVSARFHLGVRMKLGEVSVSLANEVVRQDPSQVKPLRPNLRTGLSFQPRGSRIRLELSRPAGLLLKGTMRGAGVLRAGSFGMRI